MIRPAMEMMQGMADRKLFDPKIYEPFYAMVGKFPTGGIVRTTAGLAMVTGQNSSKPDWPILDVAGRPVDAAEEEDLSFLEDDWSAAD